MYDNVIGLVRMLSKFSFLIKVRKKLEGLFS